MTEKIYLETFEKCPGSVYFPLLLTGLIILLGFTLWNKFQSFIKIRTPKMINN